jgi:hypothetical protein
MIAVLKFVFTPPRVSTRWRRGLFLLLLTVPGWIADKAVLLLLRRTDPDFWWVLGALRGGLIIGPIQGAITGLVLGTISRCVRWWVGGTFFAATVGCVVGFVASYLLLTLLTVDPLKRQSTSVEVWLIGTLGGAVTGAVAGALLSRRRGIAQGRTGD